MTTQQIIDIGTEIDGTLYVSDDVHLQETRRHGYAAGGDFLIWRRRQPDNPIWDENMRIAQFVPFNETVEILRVRPMREYPHPPYLRLPEGL